MNLLAIAMVSAALLCQGPAPLLAAEALEVTVAAECTTVGTTWDGARSVCDSEWSTMTVPEGFVFIESSYTVTVVSENGSDSQAHHEWADYVEIVPGTGITAPRTLRVRVHARSPGGSFQPGRRGWMKIRATAKYTKYR